MKKFDIISPNKAIRLIYDSGKIVVYLTLSVSGEKYNFLKINCCVTIEEKITEFPFSNPSSTEPVVNFFTDLAERKIVKDKNFLIQLKNDVEKALNIEKEDFKNYKIYFDLVLGLGNVHGYYDLPGQPPAQGEVAENFLVQEMQADLYFTLKNMFYEEEHDKFIKHIFKDYENFFISWAFNYATEGTYEAVYSSKHPYDADVNAHDIIYK